MQKAAAQSAQQSETSDRDAPVLDLSDSAVKKMIKAAKTRGFVTYDELNSVLPSEEVSSEQIEDIMAMLSDMGINVVENEDETDEADGNEEEEGDGENRALTTQNLPTKAETKSEPSERTDDPVRMYLREMGTVELLSREGEIAIAKRIEAGHEAMIAGLCESPLTFQAIIIWRDELNEGRVLLRDIIDLEATYEGPEAKAPPPPVPAPGAQQPPGAAAPAASEATTPEAKDDTNGEATSAEGEGSSEEEDEDDDEFENALSLAAMEAELKPKVLETFDAIAANYKKLRKQQDKKLELQVSGETGSRKQQEAYDKLRDEIIRDVKSLSLNNNRIESLVEQLYAINKRLVQLESQLMRIADSFAIPRTEFIAEYYGNELDQTWLERISEQGSKKWKEMATGEAKRIATLRSSIHELAFSSSFCSDPWTLR